MALETLDKALRDVMDSPSGGVVSLRRLRMPHNKMGDSALEDILALKYGQTLTMPREANRTQKNIVSAFNLLVDLLSEKFETVEELDMFKQGLRAHVTIIDVQAPSTEKALLLFETTNNRGRALAPSDLVKNVLFNHANERQYDEVSGYWQEMTSLLRQTKIDVTPFLRYVALGRYEAKLYDRDVASWFSGRHGVNGASLAAKENPVLFAKELVRLAKVVSNIRNGKTPGGETSPAFRELRALNVKQALPVMLAAADWTEGVTEVLAQELADFFFVAAVVRTRGQDIEHLLPGWIATIKQISEPTAEKVHALLHDTSETATPRSAARSMQSTFCDILGQLRYSRTSTRPTNDIRRIRYFLRHLSAHLQGDRWGKLSEIDGYLPQIEHVLAQQPTEEARSEYGVPVTEDEVHSLGNLTLLEEELNKKIGAGNFREKHASYSVSNIRLTKILTACDTDGFTLRVREEINRVWKSAPGLEPAEPWTAEKAALRLTAYTDLAKEVWFL
jgi:hypothetical protein